MPLQDDYQVSLDAFKGPLDLLLFLIRRAEVDVHDIPIATITDQYLAVLKQVDRIDIDLAGEFLVMAATLIEIKSRTLMPPETRGGADADASVSATEPGDPRYELVQQLLAYQRFRIAGEELDRRRLEFEQRHPVRISVTPVLEHEAAPIELELEDAHVLDLSEAYERIMASIDFSRLGEHTVEIDDTPIALHEEDLLDRLSRAAERRITLQEAFEGRPRLLRIGLFLATLELVRTRRVRVRQEELADAVVLELRDEEEENAAEA